MSSTAPSRRSPEFSTSLRESSTEAAGPTTSAPMDSSESVKSAANQILILEHKQASLSCGELLIMHRLRPNRDHNRTAHAVRLKLKLCFGPEPLSGIAGDRASRRESGRQPVP